ncbi:MAG: hypothetical protein AVDCRST_MAG59-1570 [uncultured Thermomicrobiales bacterium]|uniref:Uncharacterized protein n=1 Tax=uncultured Thermomicrobiales bacterium TaxID=1645740 RepID=A0A6J4UJ68_9BACT|nr:MAG: hypothetical protein AVDCRST_MAG59-1570 [uncultured Thermomicrobiales bacterium]
MAKDGCAAIPAGDDHREPVHGRPPAPVSLVPQLLRPSDLGLRMRSARGVGSQADGGGGVVRGTGGGMGRLWSAGARGRCRRRARGDAGREGG